MARQQRSTQANDTESDGSEPVPRHRRTQRVESDDDVASGNDETVTQTQSTTGIDMMVRKFVRLALACEYSRTPIRRTDVSAKVLEQTGARQFKVVFERTQETLKTVFGMQMVELPAREKITLAQRRNAQVSQKPPSSYSKSWMLTSVLPDVYKLDPDILLPTKAPSENAESTYTAIYTFIISLIMLNSGVLSEDKLERYLTRVNAQKYTPISSTKDLLAKLVKDGYLERRESSHTGEQIIEWRVGSRGKVEVGEGGVQGLVRTVYGADRVQDEELERKLQRSLHLRQAPGEIDSDGEAPPEETGPEASAATAATAGPSRPRRRNRSRTDDD